MLQKIKVQRNNPYAIPEKLDKLEADLRSRQIPEPPKELDSEIQKAKGDSKMGNQCQSEKIGPQDILNLRIMTPGEC